MPNRLAAKLLLVAFLAVANAGASVSLSNVAVSQREGTKLVDIFYDADNSNDDAVFVSVIVSNSTSEITDASFEGDIGNEVPEGAGLHIVWNGGADLGDELFPDLSITLQVSASGGEGMVLVPAGSNSGTDPDFGWYNLTVDAFYMDATEVTKAEWNVVAETTTTVSSGSGAGVGSSHPVQDITWVEAIKWCNARSLQDGLDACYNINNSSCNFSADGYRLPTDDEWEYAARGGMQGQRFPWGSSIAHYDANYLSEQVDYYDVSDTEGYHPDYERSSYPFTSPAGSFDPDNYGLYDMAGNVWEWCWNSIGAGKSRRGGSWASVAFYLQAGYKDDLTNVESPYTDNYYVGFRTVRNAEAGASATTNMVFDARNYTLSVVSAFGAPVPVAGATVLAWRAAVTCSVESAVNEGGTNYTCIGWTGAGSVPATGSSNAAMVVLSELASSIVWNWASDDTDLDGMDDDWETDFFGDLGQSATNDYDFDGQDNLSEYIAGTIPTNSASLFELYGEPGGEGFVVHWPGASNRTYNVYSTPDLVYINFKPLETNIAFPRSSATSAVSSAGFFRVDVSK
ncbi:formylglycine-generating enzyme family protein [Pontiella sulfatireligans]|nr:formylglycine-generating enzyme family protein [Pontiella sulfatireligans]